MPRGRMDRAICIRRFSWYNGEKDGKELVFPMLLMRPFGEEYDKKRWWIGPVLLFCYVLLPYPVMDGLWLAAEWSDRLYGFLAVDSNLDLLFDLYDVALCLAAIWLLRRPLSQAWAGLRAYPKGRLVVTLLLLPVIDEAMTWAEWLITDWLEGTMGVVSGNQSAIEELAATGTHTWLFVLVTAVAGPILEELIFRYGIFRPLERRSRFVAYVVTAGLFALMHVWAYAVFDGDWVQLLDGLVYLVGGVVLTAVYDVTGNITFPILLHIWCNSVATYYMLLPA